MCIILIYLYAGNELLFKNEWDSLMVLNATDLTTRLIMPNTTFVSEINLSVFFFFTKAHQRDTN